jgi:hypothetical protein
MTSKKVKQALKDFENIQDAVRSMLYSFFVHYLDEHDFITLDAMNQIERNFYKACAEGKPDSAERYRSMWHIEAKQAIRAMRKQYITKLRDRKIIL